jgi:hypothetical protein
MGCASQPKEVEPEKLKELISLEKEVFPKSAMDLFRA